MWLDRRRRTDIDRLTISDFEALTRADMDEVAVLALTTIIAGLLADGVPR
ncbi:hypothetical protein HEP87_11305 [Streptomyces sp. S1D4-11]|nr:hypothetical protein [Streptomyces sp. S1D4-11]QIY94493.1 hypothetical protein HEP87_11305 [Streptomyces sp. S1D4-11]